MPISRGQACIRWAACMPACTAQVPSTSCVQMSLCNSTSIISIPVKPPSGSGSVTLRKMQARWAGLLARLAALWLLAWLWQPS